MIRLTAACLIVAALLAFTVRASEPAGQHLPSLKAQTANDGLNVEIRHVATSAIESTASVRLLGTAPFVAARETSPVEQTFGHMTGDFRDDNEIKMPLVYCLQGDYMMGSPKSELGADGIRNDDEAQVKVTLSKAFWLGKFVVTQTEWRKVMNTEPWRDQPGTQSGQWYPATCLSWNDARKFCEKLTEHERHAGRLKREEKYDLPTEAQWEYACRAGTTTAYCFGDDDANLGQYAWFDKNAGDLEQNYAHPIGQKKPNAWGFFDMHGNVGQWCLDGYDAKRTGGFDPFTATGTSTIRVFRGGSWGRDSGACRSAYRSAIAPSRSNDSLGFRVAIISSH